jgi:hypothetical protein
MTILPLDYGDFSVGTLVDKTFDAVIGRANNERSLNCPNPVATVLHRVQDSAAFKGPSIAECSNLPQVGRAAPLEKGVREQHRPGCCKTQAIKAWKRDARGLPHSRLHLCDTLQPLCNRESNRRSNPSSNNQ